MLRFIAPLLIFIALVVFLALSLSKDPRLVPSPYIGKRAPRLDLPTLSEPATRLTNEDLLGKTTLVNIWASWCTACREEHGVLLELSRKRLLPIIGFDYKDRREDALRWLEKLGNPYTEVVVDADGRAGIEWGVYGVPETFLIDPKGTVLYKHVGPLSWSVIERTILPLIAGTDAQQVR
jgi:cytochrome c biogenesis protein CcmG/thiol:disulfide interchange protein DsbE